MVEQQTELGHEEERYRYFTNTEISSILYGHPKYILQLYSV